MNVIRTNSQHKDFITLVALLDADLASRDGADHSYYAQYNKIDMIDQVVIAYIADTPVGCGAIKPHTKQTAEVKRMYTIPSSRGKGIASAILAELEKWAVELTYKKCILETGSRQPEAIALYLKSGYKTMPNYGQYVGIENSKCFEKKL